MKFIFIGILFFSSLVFAGGQIENKILQNLKTGDGQVIGSKKEYTLLYFWATWCPDCKEKLKGTLKEAAALPNTTFTTVNTDKDEAMTKDFLAREKIEVPVAYDVSKEVRKSLKVFSVPTWTLLKKSGEQWKIVDSGVDFDLSKIKAMIK